MLKRVNVQDKKIYNVDGYKFIILESDEEIVIDGKLYKGNKFRRKKPIILE